MSDFTSPFWNWFIDVPVILGILALFIFNIRMARKRPVSHKDGADGNDPSTGHVWDGDLRELNTPLPGWWLKLFYLTLVIAVVYLVLYPGLGSFPGILHWTEVNQYNAEVKAAKARYAPLYAHYLKEPVLTLSQDPKALLTGGRLFQTHCIACHGMDAGGNPGFPNLRDNDWLHGGTPADIEQTIAHGRDGQMPAWGPVLGKQRVAEVAEYVLSLSGRQADAHQVMAGRKVFSTYCAACHGANAKGNQQIGAPNLTDKIWLYGGSRATVIKTITYGRHGHMPAWLPRLGAADVHLLAAYVYSLSHPVAATGHAAQGTARGDVR